ncbi:MAG: thiamine-phosphate kinase [Planctomycetota bacterium]
MTLRELELLGHIYQRSKGLSGLGDIVVGPGDDCAVVHTGSGLLAIGVDQLVEGRHFTSDTSIDLIARKAIARSISDLAAMGATPAWGLATATLPESYTQADELFDRMAHWAKHWGAPLIGGDIAASHGPVVLSVTAAGSISGRPVLRSGAQAGDSVFVTGAIGGSFESGRHLTFEPRLDEGREAADRANAMIDISDGLGLDATRMAEASGVMLEIDIASVPLHPSAGTWREAVAAGEDHELLICGPKDLGIGAQIGGVRTVEPGESPGAWFIDGATRLNAKSMGWEHGSPEVSG